MTGTVTTAAPGDALPPQGSTTAPIDGCDVVGPAPCPTCGRCPTCGHPAPVAPSSRWPYPWWGIVPPPETTWGGPPYMTAMGTGRTYPGFGRPP